MLYKDQQLPYALKLAEREVIFARHLEKFNRVKELMRTSRFANFGQAGPNNAYLMSVGLYHRHYSLFEAVLDQKGGSIKDLLLFFRNLSEEEGNLINRTREWLSLQSVRNRGVSS